MNRLDYGTLLAEQIPWDNVSSQFRERGTRIQAEDVLAGMLILLGICLAVWLIARFLVPRPRPRPYSSPLRLFLQLCRAHRLRWSDRWWLWRLARFHRLPDAARLFLEPERFETAGLSPPLRRRAAQLRHLRDRIFAESLPPLQKQEDSQPKTPPPAEPPRAGTPLPPLVPSPTLEVPDWPPPLPEQGISLTELP